jgi:hypothetical protein
MSKQIQPITESEKIVAIQHSHIPSQDNIDPNLQAIMDSLQLSDSNVYKILKGEIHNLITRFEETLIEFQQSVTDFQLNSSAMPNPEVQLKLSQLLSQQKEMFDLASKIKLELQQYYKMVPYLLMLSPIMWLSNLSTKQVRDTMFRQSLMIQRDRCLIDDDCESAFDDYNFTEAVEILMHTIVAGSEKGWKSNIIRNEVREVTTTIRDQTSGPQQQRKKRLGIF